jgi:hypothetical protein
VASHHTGLKADKVVCGRGDIEPEAGPATAGWTLVRNKHRVRVGLWGLPTPKKKVTGLRGIVRGGHGPA